MEREDILSKASVRLRSSAAALFVKVTAKMLWGETRSTSINQAIRCTSTRVLPLPAPAMTRAFSSGADTAARCASFRPSRICVMSNAATYADKRSVYLSRRKIALRKRKVVSYFKTFWALCTGALGCWRLFRVLGIFSLGVVNDLTGLLIEFQGMRRY